VGLPVGEEIPAEIGTAEGGGEVTLIGRKREVSNLSGDSLIAYIVWGPPSSAWGGRMVPDRRMPGYRSGFWGRNQWDVDERWQLRSIAGVWLISINDLLWLLNFWGGLLVRWLYILFLVGNLWLFDDNWWRNLAGRGEGINTALIRISSNE